MYQLQYAYGVRATGAVQGLSRSWTKRALQGHSPGLDDKLKHRSRLIMYVPLVYNIRVSINHRFEGLKICEESDNEDKIDVNTTNIAGILTVDQRRL